MKLRIFAAIAATGFLAASAASAAITITAMAAAPGDAALGHGIANGGTIATGETMIMNFGDNGGPQTPLAGFSFSPQVFDQDGGVAGYIRNGAGPPQLLSGESAPPPVFGGGYETGNYYTVTSNCPAGGTGCAQVATLTVTQGYLTTFSFYLGSPDQYNSIKFFTAQGQLGPTLTGRAMWACPGCADSGDQTFGARAIYDFGGDQVTSIQFSTTGIVAPNNSFEFDNFAGTIGGVPEPGAWALMLLGFGGMGMALRSRRRQAAILA